MVAALIAAVKRCKFTPLGFETVASRIIYTRLKSVNLPRWGLKQVEIDLKDDSTECKFTPLGFETLY